MFEFSFGFSGTALNGMAFEYSLRSGDRLCLRGDNGSGKTSLLSALAGVPSHPNQSAISRDYSGDFRTQMHFIGHRTGVHEALSIAEEWQFWHTIFSPHQPTAPCPIQDIANQVGLDISSQRIIGSLSAGQKQKVALARLFIAPRPIWLLDEADHHLDQTSRAVFEGWVQDHCNIGGIVIDTSHFLPNFGTVFSLQKAD